MEDSLNMANPHHEDLCKLFVGNINKNTSEEDFINYFSQFGPMKEILLMKDANNPSINRGFGFVTPETIDVTDMILIKGSHQLDSREMDIKRALPKDIGDPQSRLKTARIFLGGLPHKITEDDIKKYFNDRYGNIGSVEEVVIKKERMTGRPRGFCFVSFDNPHVVDKIMVELRYPIINSKRCEVKKARSDIPITGAPPVQPQKYPPRSLPPSRNQYPYRNNFPPNSYNYEYENHASAIPFPQSNAYNSYFQTHSAYSANQPVNNPYNGNSPNYMTQAPLYGGNMYNYEDSNNRILPPLSRNNYSQNERTRPY